MSLLASLESRDLEALLEWDEAFSVVLEEAKKHWGEAPRPIQGSNGIFFGRQTQQSVTKGHATYERVRAKFGRILDSAVRELDKGRIDRRGFNKVVVRALKDYYRLSYEIGKSITDPDMEMRQGDLETILAAIDEERGFLSGFSKDVKHGTGTMDRHTRAAMYVKALDSVYMKGQVAGLPDFFRIYWRLGEAEHCQDCLRLAANSPYMPNELPTVPREGHTECLSNCQCHLSL